MAETRVKDWQHIETRVDALEQHFNTAFDSFRKDQSDLGRVVGAIDTKLELFAGQLRDVTEALRRTNEKPTPWPTIVTSVAVLISIGSLSLAPVFWLSMTNFEAGNLINAELSERNKRIGSLETTVDDLAAREDRLDGRVSLIESSRYTPEMARKDRNELRDEIYRHVEGVEDDVAALQQFDKDAHFIHGQREELGKRVDRLERARDAGQ